MKTKSKTWLLALFLLTASAAAAMDIPEGIETNIEDGEFKKNVYTTLNKLIVRNWWNGSVEGEQVLIAVIPEYEKPEYDDEPEEKITLAFGIYKPAQDGSRTFINDMKQYSMKPPSQFVVKWNGNDKNGKKVPEGIYQVVMNITGEHYGDLLKQGSFPLYVSSGAPTLENPAISSRIGVLEYQGAPEFSFSTKGVNVITIVDHDEEGNELDRFEKILAAGTHTFRPTLTGPDSEPYKPGKYASKVTVSNPFGEEKEHVFRYAINKPEETLKASIALDAKNTLAVSPDTTIPYTLVLNKNAMVTLEHLSEGGTRNYLGKSTAKNPSFLLAKGTHKGSWNRQPNGKTDSHYNKGTHWLRVTARSLSGEEIIAETNKVTLTAKVETPKRAPGITLELSPEHVIIGGRMMTTIRYSIDLDSHVYISIRDLGGRPDFKDIIYTNLKKGNYSTDFAVDGLDEGSYRIRMVAKNNNGSRTIERILSVGWRK